MNQNPLSQYFRRPALYFSLPSAGKYYNPGVVNIPPNGQLPVYPMSSIDEALAKSPDGLFNGDSLVRIVRSCVPDILDPWSLNNIDMEAVIVAIRASSVDGELDVTSVCPACKVESNYAVNLMNVLAEKTSVDYDTPLLIRDLEIKFKPLTYAEINNNGIEQFKLQRTLVLIDEIEDDEKKKEIMNSSIEGMNALLYDVLTSTIDWIKTPETTVNDRNFIREFLVNTDSKTSDAIKNHSISLRQKNDTKPLKLVCTSETCKHEYTQPLVLNFTDFFA